jgi:beta-glucosidase
MHDGLPKVSVEVRNTGSRAGADVVQIYVQSPGNPIRRLAGFAKVTLAPGQARTVEVSLEPRLLSEFDVAKRRWIIRGGSYSIYGGRSATDLSAAVQVQLSAKML